MSGQTAASQAMPTLAGMSPQMGQQWSQLAGQLQLLQKTGGFPGVVGTSARPVGSSTDAVKGVQMTPYGPGHAMDALKGFGSPGTPMMDYGSLLAQARMSPNMGGLSPLFTNGAGLAAFTQGLQSGGLSWFSLQT